jgi:hypothetical protein
VYQEVDGNYYEFCGLSHGWAFHLLPVGKADIPAAVPLSAVQTVVERPIVYDVAGLSDEELHNLQAHRLFHQSRARTAPPPFVPNPPGFEVRDFLACALQDCPCPVTPESTPFCCGRHSLMFHRRIDEQQKRATHSMQVMAKAVRIDDEVNRRSASGVAAAAVSSSTDPIVISPPPSRPVTPPSPSTLRGDADPFVASQLPELSRLRPLTHHPVTSPLITEMAIKIGTSNNRNWVAKQVRDRVKPVYMEYTGRKSCQLCGTLVRAGDERVLTYYPQRPRTVWVHLRCADILFDTRWCTPRS